MNEYMYLTLLFLPLGISFLHLYCKLLEPEVFTPSAKASVNVSIENGHRLINDRALQNLQSANASSQQPCRTRAVTSLL